MAEQLPVFRFHPDPVATGAVEKKNAVCPVCGQKREYVYTGAFYSKNNVENICPWCIADGSAAQKFKGEFSDSAALEEKVSVEDLQELAFRTPGYDMLQPHDWPVHCGSPCAYLGPVGNDEIEDMEVDVRADLKRLAKDFGMSVGDFKDELEDGGPIQGYLFKCVKCGIHRLTADSD